MKISSACIVVLLNSLVYGDVREKTHRESRGIFSNTANENEIPGQYNINCKYVRISVGKV